MIKVNTVDQLDLRGAIVFYRVDYNVPMEDGRVTDTTRIEETLPTLSFMREREARIVIAAHLGRPKGQRNEKYSLKPVRDTLAEMINVEVQWADDCVGPDAVAKAKALPPGGVLLLENLRFHAEEEKNDPEFAKQLRELADLYVDDAFGGAHRAHASIVGVAELYEPSKRAAGFLMVKELDFLQKITNVSERPFVAVLGGAKIAGKIEPLEAMIKLADHVLIGGGMANTFLAAKGNALGASLVDAESLPVATKILAANERAKLHLPTDLVLGDNVKAPTKVRIVDVGSEIASDEMAADIGPKTIESYAAILSSAKTIFWNGPMGVFETKEFSAGTLAVAKAVSHAGAISIVGGGESVEAVNESGYADRISHISTGGGASLEFVSGEALPGVEVLRVG
ncbi:MAG: phosphoglycerate kinase [Thermoanaerobaculia bacterium]|nr:phosphoglycerate kinase [Thermoanaerobaculia bacterium]